MPSRNTNPGSSKRRITRACAPALLSVVLFVAGCGGDDTATDGVVEAANTSEVAEDAATTGEVATTVPVQSGDDAAGAPAAAPADTVITPFGDLPPACSVIDVAVIGRIVGADVTATEEAPTDCRYESADPAASSVRTSLYAIPADECSLFLQTEPVLPGDDVQPVPDYGVLAYSIASATGYEIQVCNADASFTVSLLAPESLPVADRASQAREVMDILLLARATS